MSTQTPPKFRPHIEGDFALAELELANRNHGLALEGLRYDITPIGMHYLLIHYDVPYGEADSWQIELDGLFDNPSTVTLADLAQFEQVTQCVTLECAGNGRAVNNLRYQSMPWRFEAVGTAEWTGVRLSDVLEKVGLQSQTHHVVFEGADRGIDGDKPDNYGRALTPKEINELNPILATHINGLPLPPQHGAPVRLIVPGWYGMASVKWLNKIEAIDHAYQGHNQVGTYLYRAHPDDAPTPVREMRVKSLIAPPGITNFYGRQRFLQAGPTTLKGRAWSGNGAKITRVEVAINDNWQDAILEEHVSEFAWCGWKLEWNPPPGEYEIACRATDAHNNTQPSEPLFDVQGFGNNAIHRINVVVE